MEAPVLPPSQAEDIAKNTIKPIAAKDIDATFKSDSIGKATCTADYRVAAAELLLIDLRRPHNKTTRLTHPCVL